MKCARAIPFFFLPLFLFLSGCVDIEVKTKINPNGSGSQSWKFTTTAFLATRVKNQIENDAFFKKNKAKFSDEFKEGDYILTADVDFKQVKELEDKYREIRFEKAGFFRTTYTYTETWKQSFDQDGLIARQAGGLVPITLKMFVELPGRIVDSNADSLDGHIARWSMPITDLIQAKTFRVVSRSWNFALMIPALLMVGGVIVIGLIFLAGALKKGGTSKTAPATRLKCPSCESSVPPGSLFCNVCGARLQQ